jgi:hypothetical protein
MHAAAIGAWAGSALHAWRTHTTPIQSYFLSRLSLLGWDSVNLAGFLSDCLTRWLYVPMIKPLPRIRARIVHRGQRTC